LQTIDGSRDAVKGASREKGDRSQRGREPHDDEGCRKESVEEGGNSALLIGGINGFGSMIDEPASSVVYVADRL
jgi:hypothetical protein